MFIDFMKDTSLFGYQSEYAADRDAYDMMILDQLRRDEDYEEDEYDDYGP